VPINFLLVLQQQDKKRKLTETIESDAMPNSKKKKTESITKPNISKKSTPVKDLTTSTVQEKINFAKEKLKASKREE